MASVAHLMQSSYASFPARPLSLIKGTKLKHNVTTLQLAAKTKARLSLRKDLHLRLGSSHAHCFKVKCQSISDSEGRARSYDSGSSTNSKNSVHVSYVADESQETIADPSLNVSTVSHLGSPKSTERIAGSPAIYKLFKKWLVLLQTQTHSEPVDDILGVSCVDEVVVPERKEQNENKEGDEQTGNKEGGKILRAIWCAFSGLDAAVKIPLLIFIPWYLSVNVIYGAEISKELTPLWLLGPLIFGFYIKMLRGLLGLYIFSFKKTVEVFKNSPTYFSVAYDYIIRGKLKEDIRVRVWQPVEHLKNLDYKDLSRRKLKQSADWLVEQYLDFVESIWPFYCRTIRFLKRANLI